MSMLQCTIQKENIPFNALLAISLGIHIILLGGAVLLRGSSATLPHLQSITVEIKNIDFPEKEVAPKVKELSTARPAAVQAKSEAPPPVSPAAAVQRAEIQPSAKLEEMPLPVQAPAAPAARPVPAALPLAAAAPKPSLPQSVATPGKAAAAAAQSTTVGREYTAVIRGLIDQQKEYPLMARKTGAEGTVFIRFVLARDGRLKRAEVSRSSGRSILDKAAVNAVTSVSRFPPVPEALEGAELNFELPLLYKIAGN